MRAASCPTNNVRAQASKVDPAVRQEIILQHELEKEDRARELLQEKLNTQYDYKKMEPCKRPFYNYLTTYGGFKDDKAIDVHIQTRKSSSQENKADAKSSEAKDSISNAMTYVQGLVTTACTSLAPLAGVHVNAPHALAALNVITLLAEHQSARQPFKSALFVVQALQLLLAIYDRLPARSAYNPLAFFKAPPQARDAIQKVFKAYDLDPDKPEVFNKLNKEVEQAFAEQPSILTRHFTLLNRS
jgi:hypothetical protein